MPQESAKCIPVGFGPLGPRSGHVRSCWLDMIRNRDGSLVRHKLGKSRIRRSDHWDSGGHGLSDGKTEPLAACWVHITACQVVKRSNFLGFEISIDPTDIGRIGVFG